MKSFASNAEVFFLFSDVKEYCETEVFNATCAVDEIILVSHARYGRMRVGRCVKLDYGHVGCAADVLNIADNQCSGKRQCIMPIPDTQLARTKPCPDDLKPYFEATYLCVKGMKGTTSLWFNNTMPNNTLVLMHVEQQISNQ